MHHHYYKLKCPICSVVIEGPANHLDNCNEEDRTYEDILEGDARLCRWENIPMGVWSQIVMHRYNYNKQEKKKHPELMLAPDLTINHNPKEMEQIVKEGSRLVIRSATEKSLDQCPVTSLHLLILSYMTTKWSPPSSNFSTTAILKVKKHLSVWGAVRYRKVRIGRAISSKTELLDLMESLTTEVYGLQKMPSMYPFLHPNYPFQHPDQHPNKNDHNINRFPLRDQEDLEFMESAIHKIVVSVLDNLDNSDTSIIFSNNFKPDKFVRYMVDLLSKAVKEAIPCPFEETKDYYEEQVEVFALMVASHLKCIAQCKETK